MTSMLYSVLPIEESDIPKFAEFLFAQQSESATNRFLFLDWLNESAQLSLYTAEITKAFNNPSSPFTQMLKVVDNVSGDIIASLGLTRKNHTGATLKEEADDPEEIPDGVNPEYYAELLRLSKAVEKGMEGVDRVTVSWC